jgi:FkbM family methyltransferase
MGSQFNEISLISELPIISSPNRFIIDVGAHVGTATKPFAIRGCSVIAFEPEPNNFRQLCINVLPYPSVTCIRKAVSDTAGKGIPFYVSDEHWGIHSLKPFHKSHKPTAVVETVRLDDTLRHLDIRDVSVVKIDTEGADFLALKSIDWNRIHPDVVVCEFMDNRSTKLYEYTHHDVVAYMKEKGFSCHVSEWADFEEYGRRGHSSSHRFIQCKPYPLTSVPVWGNLIFLSKDALPGFEQILNSYLVSLSSS